MYDKVLRGFFLFSAIAMAVSMTSCVSSDTAGYMDDYEEDDDYDTGADYSYMNTEKSNIMVFFPFNSAVVTPENKELVRQIAQIMKTSGDEVEVRIEGHCDQRGTREYNIALGEKRASNVKAILVEEFNIAENRITIVSRGKDALLLNEETEEAYRRNRRVEFYIKKPSVDTTRRYFEQNPAGTTDWVPGGYMDGISGAGD